MTCGFKSPELDDPKRGKPRIQYERTYVLLPQDHGAEWAEAAIEATWDDERYTIGSSADDAGVGDLDVRRIIAVNPDHWPGDLKAFFDEYYPEIVYVPIEASTPEELALKLKPRRSIAGTHDQAGAEWMVANGVKGWCVIPLYLGGTAQAIAGLERYRDAGVNVILRLNYSWAVDDGGQGTMPGSDKLHAFEQACIQTIKQNPAAWGFVYCNETNNKREWPDSQILTPEYYVSSYNVVWYSIPQESRLAAAAIDPYNPGWGDWREVLPQMLNSIGGADFMAFHCYTHGWPVELIWHDKRFEDEPLKGVHYDLLVLEDQQRVLPAKFQALPHVVTETNPDADGTLGWPDSGDWVYGAYGYFRERGVVGACLFRYNHDKWRYGDKQEVLRAIKEESGR